MLRRAFEALDRRAIIRRYQTPESLPFNQLDVERLAGLPEGYFDERDEDGVWNFIEGLTAGSPC